MATTLRMKRLLSLMVAVMMVVALCAHGIPAHAAGGVDAMVHHIYDGVSGPSEAKTGVAPAATDLSGWARRNYDGKTYDIVSITVDRTPVTYTVNYMANGGTGGYLDANIPAGHYAVLGASATGVSRPGYDFVAWNTQAGGAGTWISPGQTLTISDHVTLYAQWSAQIQYYTVRFDVDGGELAPANQTVAQGAKATEPTEPVKGGYIFSGWYQAADFSGSAWDFGADPVMGNMTLYAKWTIPVPTYTVNFDANGGLPMPPTQTVEQGEKVIEPADPEKSGFDFSGWYQAADFSGSAWDFDNDTVTDNITLYAMWDEQIVYYTVTFETNGGTPVPDPQTVAKGQKVTKPVNPIKDGFMFVDWYPTPQASGTPWIFGLNTVTGDITLYARWTQPVRMPIQGVQASEPQPDAPDAPEPEPAPVPDPEPEVVVDELDGPDLSPDAQPEPDLASEPDQQSSEPVSDTDPDAPEMSPGAQPDPAPAPALSPDPDPVAASGSADAADPAPAAPHDMQNVFIGSLGPMTNPNLRAAAPRDAVSPDNPIYTFEEGYTYTVTIRYGAPSPSPTPTPKPTPKPTPSPTPSPTPEPEETPEPAPEPTPDPTPTPIPENVVDDLTDRMRDEVNAWLEHLLEVEGSAIPLAGILSKNVGVCKE